MLRRVGDFLGGERRRRDQKALFPPTAPEILDATGRD
jgi:hypothetical protein